jgi:ABC-type glutathione transport system ATPase component
MWCGTGDARLHFHNVSLMARAGEMLAVVGLSCAGNSTLPDIVVVFHEAGKL